MFKTMFSTVLLATIMIGLSSFLMPQEKSAYATIELSGLNLNCVGGAICEAGQDKPSECTEGTLHTDSDTDNQKNTGIVFRDPHTPALNDEQKAVCVPP
jgi:hypothetical protein